MAEPAGHSTARARAAPALFVIVRKSLDWADEAAVRAKMRDDLRRKAATWDAVFRMPYRLFRLRLAEIAKENWARLDGVPVVPLDAVPAGALVAPVDDDDWFAPDLGARVREAFDPAARGWHWPCHVLEPQRLRRRRFLLFGPRRASKSPARDLTFTCETNGYAVVNEDPWRGLTTSHGLASRHFDAFPALVRPVAPTLGVYNKNLASMSVLNWPHSTIEPDFLRRRFRRYRRFYRPGAVPESVAWARPYVARMDALMADLSLA